MAKFFYTLEEAAARLSVSEDRVREMASSGQLQEFRDRDKLVFKREQVDLLAGDDAGGGGIPLVDTGEIGLADTGSVGTPATADGSSIGLADSATKEKSGISIFEADELDQDDPSAQTQVAPTMGGLSGFGGDAGGSGSAILDLTRNEDTAAGATLLQDVYGQSGAGAPGDSGAPAGAGLFEPAGVASDVGGSGGGGVMVLAAEPFEPGPSGFAGGLALGMVALMSLVLAVVILAMTGVAGIGLVQTMAGNFPMWLGILAGSVALFGLLGWFLGRRG
ncbi:MAG: hypothetical protein C0475_04050 [Planctomyces sp.]|nr:hypothetical protein [Planctomyces sp.]MBA4039899.1 hypothetical protein [Planctomyces sp.]MBA4120202.1 hypothetical protein [Isosphaera sp.]